MTAALVDNTAALSSTTPAAAMSASAYNCDKGDDTKCVTQWGVGSCCFMATVNIVGTQTDYNLPQAMLGWPTGEGESNVFCLDKVNIDYYAQIDETL